MLKHLLALWLVLLFAGLACSAPTWGDVDTTLDLPTPAPSAEPTADDRSSQPPLVFQGLGRRTSYAASSSVETWCQSNLPLELTVREDGTAELRFTGPMIVDHLNCTAGDGEETWMVAGRADEANQAVTFQSCNEGGFKASGTLSFREGQLEGEVTCFGANGNRAVTMQVNP